MSSGPRHPRNQPELQEWLERVTGYNSDHIAFNPPPDTIIKRPTFRYRLSSAKDHIADNRRYAGSTCYEIILISADPACVWFERMRNWPMCRFRRSYQAEGLSHWVFDFWTAL